MLGSINCNSLSSALDWYQKKLGSYDQQLWEKSVEERVMKGLTNAIPKKLARVKTELIDLDLIRGSAFTKAKPKQGCIATTCIGIIRVLLYPFFMKWWTDQTNKALSTLFCLMYLLQVSSMYMYFNFDQKSDDLTSSCERNALKEALEDVPTSEVLVPVIMLLILSVIQSHIAASHSDDEEDEEDEGHMAAGDRTPPPLSSDYQSIFREEDLLNDDPDSFPPHILSFGVFEPRSVSTDNRSEYVSCAIWQQNECQKVDLTVIDISSAVIRKAAKTKYSNEYLYLAFAISLFLAAIPGLFRLQATSAVKSSNTLPSMLFGGHSTTANQSNLKNTSTSSHQLPHDTSHSHSDSHSSELIDTLLNQIPVAEPSVIIDSLITPSSNWVVRFIVLVAIIERYCMSAFFFFLLCVAERTYKERFMFSKYFCHLTSARRARRSGLPHFRLNKVRNIKTWLSVRSYLKRHGPQRSVDVIVSCSFILAVVILTVLCMQLLREEDTCSSKLYCWEMLSWNLAIGFYILRLMVLGIKMNRKYKSNLSVLITEQINLYFQLEQKPHKKEELTLANHVLKLAADLLKQLEVPFKISGFSANNYLYNITKVVVLSAFSAVLTELLGFKLKLHKIKL